MKIYFFTKYNKQGASSRYRSIQYFNDFSDNGYQINHQPLFNDLYLKLKYKKNYLFIFILISSYLTRFFSIIKLILFRPEIIIIEKELFPYLPINEGGVLSFFKINYILDYDDAIWHNYDLFLIKNLMYNKFSNLAKKSKVVFSGSHYLKESLIKFGSKKNYLIPTVVDLNKYPKHKYNNEGKFIIGWIGSPSTSAYLFDLNSVLTDFCNRNNALVHLVGFDENLSKKLNFKFKLIKWSKETEVDEINKFSVGLMPLPNSRFAQGKCGFKLIQYMASGISVIASDFGENKFIVDDGINGILCKDEITWRNALNFFYENKKKRQIFGENGRNKVESIYNKKTQFQYLIKIINNTIDEKKNSYNL